MDKPITLLKEDFVNGLVELVNNSHLPIFVVRTCLQDACESLVDLERQQLEADRKAYAEATAEEKSKE